MSTDPSTVSSQSQPSSNNTLKLLNTHIALLTQHSQSLVAFQQRLFHRDSQLTQQEIELTRLIAQAEEALQSATSLRDEHLAAAHTADALNKPANGIFSNADTNGARKRPSESAIEVDGGHAKRLRIDAPAASQATERMEAEDGVQYGDIVAEVEARLRARDAKGLNGAQAGSGPARLVTAKRKRSSGDSIVARTADTMNEMIVTERTGKRLKAVEYEMQFSKGPEAGQATTADLSSQQHHRNGVLMPDAGGGGSALHREQERMIGKIGCME